MSVGNALIVEGMVTKTLKTMMHLVIDENVRVYDWHSRNIAFRDRCAVQVVLIDWQGNEKTDAAQTKRNMRQAFEAFYGTLTCKVRGQEEGWGALLDGYRKTCMQWWQQLWSLPTMVDVDRLFSQLHALLVDSVPIDLAPPPAICRRTVGQATAWKRFVIACGR